LADQQGKKKQLSGHKARKAAILNASYDHLWSHLVGIPYRLKDPPRILYHGYEQFARTQFLQLYEHLGEIETAKKL
jgi:hypothetical protein